MRTPLKFLLLAVLPFLTAVASATQVHGPTFCYPLGEWDTAANLNTDRPPASYPCAQALTDDSGYMFNPGGTWISLNSLITFPTQAPPTVGTPTSRSLSLSTAYQATTSANAAVVTVNLTSSASLTLTTGTTNTASVIIGSTTAVASGTGTTIGQYSNSLTGSLVIGLNVSTSSQSPITFALPAGWYFAVIQGTGSVTISSAFDQKLS